MKRLIGFSLVVVLYVLFSSSLVYGADENVAAVSASDIWFPSNIAKWTYLQTDTLIPDEPEHYVDVVEESKQVGEEYYSAIHESRRFLKGRFFDLFRIDSQGNILSLGESFSSILINNLITTRGIWKLSNKELENAYKNFKVSSEEWLLLPAQLKDGQGWTVVSYEFDFGKKEKYEIRGEFKNNVPPSSKSEALVGREKVFCRVDYKDTESNSIFCSFIFLPKVGLVETRTTDGEIPAQLIEFQKAIEVQAKGKVTTTWGKIKTQ